MGSGRQASQDVGDTPVLARAPLQHQLEAELRVAVLLQLQAALGLAVLDGASLGAGVESAVRAQTGNVGRSGGPQLQRQLGARMISVVRCPEPERLQEVWGAVFPCRPRLPSSDGSVSSLNSHNFHVALWLSKPTCITSGFLRLSKLCPVLGSFCTLPRQAEPGLFQGSAPAPCPPEALPPPAAPPPPSPLLQSTQPARCSSPRDFSSSALLPGGGITCFLVYPPSTLRVLGLINFCALHIQQKARFITDR